MGSGSLDAYPVPPVAKELWGVRSSNAYVGAFENGTTVSVVAGDGTTETLSLSAGQYMAIGVGSNANQGQGDGIHLVADKPIAAIQYSDGDGGETTAFWPIAYFSMRFGFPVDTQYAAVVCASDAGVTLFDGAVEQTLSCLPSGAVPGKVYFGLPTNGANIAAGAYIESTAPVYLYSETSAVNDEVNLRGTTERYFVLDPEAVTAAYGVVSFVDGNVVETDGVGFPLVLDEYDLDSFPQGALSPGNQVRSLQPFVLGSDQNGSDLPSLERFIGTRFVVPHGRGSHTYTLLSPDGDAVADVTINGVTTQVALPHGQSVSYAAGSNNTVAGIVTANRPILLRHQAAGATDAYSVPPVAYDLWGVNSQKIYVGALEDGTTIDVLSGNGQSAVLSLDAGERGVVGIGLNASQGQGDAVYLSADKPIAAIQQGDGDGSESTAFWSSAFFSARYGLPFDVQYVAAVCAFDAQITLTDPGLDRTEVQDCTTSGDIPGKAYFGSALDGVNIAAGAYLESRHPSM